MQKPLLTRLVRLVMTKYQKMPCEYYSLFWLEIHGDNMAPLKDLHTGTVQ